MDNGTMSQADYLAQSMIVSYLISALNPTWDAVSSDADAAFLNACEIATSIFDRVSENAISKASTENIVEKAIEKSKGHIMLFNRYIPWQDFIFSSNNPKAVDIEFVIFPSSRGGYNCQCVPDALGSSSQRKSLPESWRGLRDKALQDISGWKQPSSATQQDPSALQKHSTMPSGWQN